MARAHRRAIRRLTALAVALSLAMALGGCSLLTPKRADVAPATVRSKLSAPTVVTDGALTIGIVANDAPQVIADGPSGLTGYTVDVGRALAQRLGLAPVFVAGADPSKVGAAAGVDVYLGAEERDLSDGSSLAGTFLEDAPALFAMGRGASATTGAPSAQDLASATIAVQTGSSAHDILAKTGIQATQKTYANVNESLAAVARGEADYAACEATSGGYLARAYPGMALVCTLDEPSVYGVAVRTSNDALAGEVRSALDALNRDGTLDAIHRAWYGALPSSLSDTMAPGVATSAERAAARVASSREAAAGSASADGS